MANPSPHTMVRRFSLKAFVLLFGTALTPGCAGAVRRPGLRPVVSRLGALRLPAVPLLGHGCLHKPIVCAIWLLSAATCEDKVTSADSDTPLARATELCVHLACTPGPPLLTVPLDLTLHS